MEDNARDQFGYVNHQTDLLFSQLDLPPFLQTGIFTYSTYFSIIYSLVQKGPWNYVHSDFTTSQSSLNKDGGDLSVRAFLCI